MGGERDRENNAFLQDDSIDDDEFELMLLTLLPVGPVSPRRLSMLS